MKNPAEGDRGQRFHLRDREATKPQTQREIPAPLHYTELWIVHQ
jgi:hypothetical protein